MSEDVEKGNLSIGSRVRALRKIRGISLQQLSQETGMSYSYLSGLENDKHSVSITNLQRLASFFEVDMVYFLIPPGPTPRVFRVQDLFQKENVYGNIVYHVCTRADSGDLQVSYAHLPPHEPSERSIHKHGIGQEMVLVLSGSAFVMVGEEKYQLEQGSSIIFKAETEHLIYTEDQPATIVIISSPPYGQNLSGEDI